jgi:molecular chaperone GrpE (heat shock protein)
MNHEPEMCFDRECTEARQARFDELRAERDEAYETAEASADYWRAKLQAAEATLARVRARLEALRRQADAFIEDANEGRSDGYEFAKAALHVVNELDAALADPPHDTKE